jgi:transposase
MCTGFVGIDVSKDSWDVHLLPSDEFFSVDSDPAGHKKILKRLPQPGSCLIVMEATGGYERDLAATLFDAGRQVAIVNPKRARDFAKAMGLLAKTDRVDARALALFAGRMRPRLSQKTPAKRAELDELKASPAACASEQQRKASRGPGGGNEPPDRPNQERVIPQRVTEGETGERQV